MVPTSVTIVIVCGILLLVVGLAAGVSWATTRVAWDATMPRGGWAVRVQNEQGSAIPNASLSLLLPKTGKIVSYGVADSDGSAGPFDNYTGPGSVTAGADGVVSLRNTRGLRYGGEYWKLFWIWEIGTTRGPESLLVQVSAPRHQAARIPAQDLLSAKEIILKLRRTE
jgi:hypothetical protein